MITTTGERYRLGAYVATGTGFVFFANAYPSNFVITIGNKRYTKPNILSRLIIPFVGGVYTASAMYHSCLAVVDPFILVYKIANE